MNRTAHGFNALVATLLLLLFFGAAPCPAEEESPQTPGKLEVGYNVDLLTKYVWRAQNLTDDTVLQPSVTLGGRNLKFALWANMDLTNVNGRAGVTTEIDYTATYAWSSDKWKYSLGVANYSFPTGAYLSMTELFASVSYDAPLTCTLTLNHEVESAHGYYAALSLNRSFDLSRRVCLSLAGTLGYSSTHTALSYFRFEKSGFSDALFSMQLPVKFSESLSVAPGIYYSTVLDGDMRTQQKNDNVWYGLTFSGSF